jgi:hypothetical protein
MRSNIHESVIFTESQTTEACAILDPTKAKCSNSSMSVVGKENGRLRINIKNFILCEKKLNLQSVHTPTYLTRSVRNRQEF